MVKGGQSGREFPADEYRSLKNPWGVWKQETWSATALVSCHVPFTLPRVLLVIPSVSSCLHL